ncbi:MULTISPECIES: winged helix-turn-helix domain-containing protein [Micromonospora]|uniref:GntR family transcriptional regulator n=1 Tax=Micromonospora tulbaghiae TaxID=479978 RepID=A0A386WF58_9ACTN|nr:winged helix-turn-helix domain-containing protein [Micromonospora tulbaghiae]AYF26955.1 GntR family transcriptional regulator [Micromonospora tulbaghiae]NED58406.1 winged helix-turn-helix transcriptional regulator [Micromonospora aurantiaca]
MPIPMSSRQIADDLTARIRGHEYQAGEKLPTLKELADLYSVSVSTIQRALELTRDRGLTIGRPGAGVYVAEQPQDASPSLS